MVRIMTLAFVCALALVLVARADEGKKDDKKDKKDEKPKTAVVKFELLKSGHMAVDVKVNGKGPYKLIFATGAPISLVNNKLAKEAGLITGKENKSPFDLFGSGGEKKVKTLEVGDAKAEDVSVMVMDHPTV